MARRKYSDEEKDKTIAAVVGDFGGNRSAAAEALGIPVSTIDLWMNTHQPAAAPTADDQPIGVGLPLIERLNLIAHRALDAVEGPGVGKFRNASVVQAATTAGICIDKHRQLVQSDAMLRDLQSAICEIVQRHVADPSICAAIAVDLDKAVGEIRLS